MYNYIDLLIYHIIVIDMINIMYLKQKSSLMAVGLDRDKASETQDKH